jgi:hypothetical protein
VKTAASQKRHTNAIWKSGVSLAVLFKAMPVFRARFVQV